MPSNDKMGPIQNRAPNYKREPGEIKGPIQNRAPNYKRKSENNEESTRKKKDYKNPTYSNKSSADSLIPSFSFSVQLDNIKMRFKKVSNISGSIEVETVVNGGFNETPVILRKPKKNPDMLVFEKGLYSSKDDLSFAALNEGSRINSIIIMLLRNGQIVRTFCAEGGVVIKRQFTNLDAMESAVMMETLQVAHMGITEIPVVI